MKIREVVGAFGPTVPQSQLLGKAEKLMRDLGCDYLTVTGAGGEAMGVITHGDVEAAKQSHPNTWSTIRCAAAVQSAPRQLGPDDEVEMTVELLTHHGVRPLLIYDKDKPVGVLEPTAVFQWCAEHRPHALDKLAFIASSEERDQYPQSWRSNGIKRR